MTRAIVAVALLIPAAQAVTFDRIAVTVGKDVITESEVNEEVRVTAFLNSAPLDSSAQARRAAADRLVDQYLIRQEMELAQYGEPSSKETEDMLRQFKSQHFSSESEYRAALARYGVTEDQVKAHLAWQLAAIRFTDQRFQPGIPAIQTPSRAGATEQAIVSGRNSANREARPPHAPSAKGGTVDDQLAAWLEEARRARRIEYREEAFQ